MGFWSDPGVHLKPAPVGGKPIAWSGNISPRNTSYRVRRWDSLSHHERCWAKHHGFYPAETLTRCDSGSRGGNCICEMLTTEKEQK